MNARIIYKENDGTVQHNPLELDLDDAFSTARILLNLEKTKMVFLQTISGRFSYYVTKRGSDYKILSTTNSNI